MKSNRGGAMEFTLLEQRLIGALKNVVAEAQPIPAPLGPSLMEHVDTYLPSIERARELLKNLEEA